MLAELVAPKFADRWIGIHDSGDYSTRWLRITGHRAEVNFYCYTEFTDHRFTRT